MSPWIRNLLIGLGALYVAELVVKNLWAGFYGLVIWQPLGEGFAPWQLLTRYFVQEGDPAGRDSPLSVVFSLLTLGFMLPALDQGFSRAQLARAASAALIGGTLMALLLDALGFVGGFATSWRPLVVASLTLFGLALPTQELRLAFVLPIRGEHIVWGAGIVSFLFILWAPVLASADYFGAWVGVMIWWNTAGPGGRRRKLVKDSRRIEAELRRFDVIQGGKNSDIVH